MVTSNCNEKCPEKSKKTWKEIKLHRKCTRKEITDSCLYCLVKSESETQSSKTDFIIISAFQYHIERVGSCLFCLPSIFTLPPLLWPLMRNLRWGEVLAFPLGCKEFWPCCFGGSDAGSGLTLVSAFRLHSRLSHPAIPWGHTRVGYSVLP